MINFRGKVVEDNLMSTSRLNLRFYGIDQTGATLNRTKAKPLKACKIFIEKNLLFNIKFFYIDRLGDWISNLNTNHKHHIFIDCVLGLPIDLFHSNNDLQIRDWIKTAEHFQDQGRSYGLNVSEKFFDNIKKFYQINSKEYPKRTTEIKFNSNSVFTTRPFQKNIQTGTFRIWKEIAPVLNQIIIWPIDFYLKNELNTTIYEVYPSDFYKKIFNLKNRNSDPLKQQLKNISKINPQFDIKTKLKFLEDPDFCDAFMAALGGYYVINQKDVWKNLSPNSFFEGEILD